jgi:PAS domain S-box-containing protein
MVEGVAIHEMVFDKNRKPINYRIVDINRAYEINTGIKISAAKGKLATEVYAQKIPPYLKEYYGVISNGKPFIFETYFEPLERYFLISVFPLDKNHFVSVFQDITDRKNFETKIAESNLKNISEKKKFENVVKEMADAVVVIDKTNKITLVNKAMEKLSGYSERELMGKNYDGILKFVFDKDGKFLKDIPDVVFEKGIEKRPYQDVSIVRKDGKKMAVDGVASPITDEKGAVVGVVGIIRDVSKQRELDKLKTDFVSLASHQLRTPLTGIKWFSELLSEKSNKFPDDELSKYIRSIKESNERMITLVNDMLSVSRIESGKTLTVGNKTLSLKKILEMSIEDQNKLIQDMKVKVIGVEKIDSTIKVRGDLSNYLQIFGNLINNAVKYSHRNSEVFIKVSKNKKDLRVTIADSGLGIPADQTNRLFEKFFRADNVSRNIPGSGLGLYLVKSLIDNYGGKIVIESKEGEGTHVYVKLPYIIKPNG